VEWLDAFANAAGVAPPSSDDIDILLRVASVAAHASERTAAPITCWIAALAGLNPAQALALAESIGSTAQ
jgi:hypothetical protein